MPAKREDITDEGVTKLASFGCTQNEIADYYGCARSTVTGRFGQAWTLGRAKVQRNVRLWQMRNARKGSDAMLIHLGRHYCSQTEKNAQPDGSGDDRPTGIVIPTDDPRDETPQD